MFERFTPTARRVVVLATEAAAPGQVTSAHVLVGLVRAGDDTSRRLQAAGVSDAGILDAAATSPTPTAERFSADARTVFTEALQAAAANGPAARVDTAELLAACCDPSSGPAYMALIGLDADIDGLSEAPTEFDDLDDTSPMSGATAVAEPPRPGVFGGPRQNMPPSPLGRRSGQRSALAEFGVDLTAAALDGSLDPVVGRNVEVERVIQVLGRRSKRNPVLVGEPGVGKTAVVEGLAQRIAAGAVPDALTDVHVFSIDMGSLLAGTKLRGDFEDRVRRLLAEASERDDVVLFVDEVHTMVSAGSAGDASSAAEMFKPALARDDFAMIGATTLAEWRLMEAQPALARRFTEVRVLEPTEGEAVRILAGQRSVLSTHHGVSFDDAAVRSAVRYARRYLTDRRLPDSALDLLDEAGAAAAIARMRGGGSSTVTDADIATVLTDTCGVPVGALDAESAERLSAAESVLSTRVIGQDAAVAAVASAVRRSRVGLSDPKRPDGSFMFIGPSGVGKTELAKALAEFLFGDDTAMISVDMSEYMESHAVSRLIGAAPGLVGYAEGGQLTEAVRRRPHSVVLFDEVEKAHPKVFDVLLQVLEEGRLTDSSGRVVDFSNTVLIMTSNLGSAATRRTVGFSSSNADPTAARAAAAQKALEGHFRPEFLNRVDDVVVFDPLSAEALLRIVSNMIDELTDTLSARGVTLSVTHEAKVHLAAQASDPALGARPLRRAVTAEVTDPVTELLLGPVPEGTVCLVDVIDGAVVVSMSVTDSFLDASTVASAPSLRS